jgi:hypothetical protein
MMIIGIEYLKKENDSLRDVLRTSKETITMLQSRLSGSESDIELPPTDSIIITDDSKRKSRQLNKRKSNSGFRISDIFEPFRKRYSGQKKNRHSNGSNRSGGLF